MFAEAADEVDRATVSGEGTDIKTVQPGLNKLTLVDWREGP